MSTGFRSASDWGGSSWYSLSLRTTCAQPGLNSHAWESLEDIATLQMAGMTSVPTDPSTWMLDR